MKVYSRTDALPAGHATDHITKGCLVLEGGAFRGLFTTGVLDALMLEDINLQCVIGVSAGALNGYNYVSGNIGHSARVNLLHRHDGRWVGLRAMFQNKGVIGFDYLFSEEMEAELPHNMERFHSDLQRFVVVATNCETGRPTLFEHNHCKMFNRAVAASASMPLVTKMVDIGKGKYLDGGCAVKIPIAWALQQNYDKIVVVRTRDRKFRKAQPGARLKQLEMNMYRKYPAFLNGLFMESDRYNHICDQLEKLEDAGRIFTIAPEIPITVGRLEGDMEKLGELYWQGYEQAMRKMGTLRQYLDIRQ